VKRILCSEPGGGRPHPGDKKDICPGIRTTHPEKGGDLPGRAGWHVSGITGDIRGFVYLIGVDAGNGSGLQYDLQGANMRKLTIVLVFFSVSVLLPGQQQFDITVRNVSVPVRVFDGDTFVDDLTIEDFEVLEDGRPQKVMAMYLTRKSEIERMEGRDYMPYSGRFFYFIFQLYENHPRILDALDYFFTHIYVPEDQLVVMTPLKVYELNKDLVANSPKETVVEYIQNTIRKDTLTAAQQYNSLMKDLIRNAQGISRGDVTSSLPQYRQNLMKLEQVTAQDERRLVGFASQLKRLDGQKNVFYFCQSEYRPKLRPLTLSNLLEQNQGTPNIYGELQELFTFYTKESNLDVERITQIFADSSILFNFIYINRRPEGGGGSIQMEEQSEDVFEAFSKIAESTGGAVENSQNPAAALEKSAALSESYYLLYYSPENYKKDGEYKGITVKVKGREYKIFHRLGYIAD
jgi:VWFA-related protein